MPIFHSLLGMRATQKANSLAPHPFPQQCERGLGEWPCRFYVEKNRWQRSYISRGTFLKEEQFEIFGPSALRATVNKHGLLSTVIVVSPLLYFAPTPLFRPTHEGVVAPREFRTQILWESNTEAQHTGSSYYPHCSFATKPPKLTFHELCGVGS